MPRRRTNTTTQTVLTMLVAVIFILALLAMMTPPKADPNDPGRPSPLPAIHLELVDLVHRTPPATLTPARARTEPAFTEAGAAWVRAVLLHRWVAWSLHRHPFLVCTRAHESSHTPPLHDDGYAAVNPTGTYRGAYQFSRSTWNNTARHAGIHRLVDVDPAAASIVDQDRLAYDLMRWQGADPWLDRCTHLIE